MFVRIVLRRMRIYGIVECSKECEENNMFDNSVKEEFWVEAWNVQDGVVTVSDSLKTGVGSTPIRLAQQQVSARICDTNIFYSQLLDNLLTYVIALF